MTSASTNLCVKGMMSEPLICKGAPCTNAWVCMSKGGEAHASHNRLVLSWINSGLLFVFKPKTWLCHLAG